MAQTSDRVSTIAAKRSGISAVEIADIVTNGSPGSVELLARDIRALAGSALRQDETKGPRKSLIRRIFG